MKIELIDRDYWLTIVEQKLQHIEAVRQQENKRMESMPWYRKMFLNDFEYPSMYGWWIKDDLELLQYTLQMDHTEVIYIGEDQLYALRW